MPGTVGLPTEFKTGDEKVAAINSSGKVSLLVVTDTLGLTEMAQAFGWLVGQANSDIAPQELYEAFCTGMWHWHKEGSFNDNR